MPVPDPAPILELIEAFRRSKVLFTACALDIFDRVAALPQSAAALAADTGSSAEAMERLLEACVSLGLLEMRQARGDDVLFANTVLASTYITRKSPHSLAGYLRYSNEILYPMWGHLEDAVQAGTNRWEQTFQFSSTELFDQFYRSEESMRTFLMGMHGFGMLSSPAVAAAFDLGRFARMVDLGGATGHLVLAACERHPQLRGIVFDFPRVVEFARSLPAPASVKERVTYTGGDFFSDPLPPADLYCLGRILHDWSAAKIQRLLAKILASLPAGGALLVAEKLLDEDRRGPISVHLQSLNMLICTEGRERSLSEYQALFLRAGFSHVEGKRTGQPLDAILAIK